MWKSSLHWGTPQMAECNAHRPRCLFVSAMSQKRCCTDLFCRKKRRVPPIGGGTLMRELRTNPAAAT
eukprot:976311-Alexandrium_andersonii.AAC.1